MPAPWWRSYRGLEPLIEAGEQQGYVTVDQFNELILPDPEPDMIEDILQALSERGIHLVEGGDGSED